MDPRGSSAFKMLFEGENHSAGNWQMDRILIILKKENGPRASSAPALGLTTIIFKYVYWYMKQISGERLQDHWSSGLYFVFFSWPARRLFVVLGAPDEGTVVFVVVIF